MKPPALTYRDAGVDLDAADRFVAFVRKHAKLTYGNAVVDSGDAYAGLVRPPLSGLADPLLAATCDGVGTKLLVARDCQDYSGIGQDLVAMNVNDLLPRGARPLFFLDYIAAGRLDSVPLADIASGIIAACQQSGCALLGGETAELPDAYLEGDCDLAGFAVGIVDAPHVPKADISDGDLLYAFPSSGIHANGLSLARRIVADAGLSYQDTPSELPHSLAKELLIPTRLYVQDVLSLHKQVRVKAAAHVTGGGLLLRAHKLCPPGLRLTIDPDSYVRPAIFSLLARLGGVSWEEMAKTFNMGIGFLLVMGPSDAETLSQVSCGDLRPVGKIVRGERGVDLGYARS